MSNNHSSTMPQNSGLSNILRPSRSSHRAPSRDLASNLDSTSSQGACNTHYGAENAPFSHIISNHTNALHPKEVLYPQEALHPQEKSSPVPIASAVAIDSKLAFRDDFRHIASKTTHQRKSKRQSDSKN